MGADGLEYADWLSSGLGVVDGMRVAIFGPGAMGCLYGAYLSRGGHSVVLVDHDNDRAAKLAKSGITVDCAGDVWTADVETTLTAPTDVDLQIILVKAYSTERINPASDIPTLTLQNGLGNAEILCDKVGSANVLAGSTSEGAHLKNVGHVVHAGRGITTVGSWTSCPVEFTVEILSQAGFNTESTDAPGQTLWEKTAINAGINPITALINVPNGKLLEIPEARQLMRDLVVEAVKVSGTEGYRFSRSLVEVAEDTCRDTAENISSMLQDVRAGRRTEIDAITGQVLERATHAALPCPRTRVVYQLLKGMEQR